MSLEEDRLLKNLRMNLPGAIDPVIKLELFNCADEFFTNTNLWYEEVDFVAVPTTREYLFESGGASRIHRLEYVTDTDKTRKIAATMDEPGVVVLGTAVGERTNLVCRLIYSVRDPEDDNGMPQIPAAIMQKYYNAFLEGTLSRMMSHPAKPYSNERMAVYHGRKFRDMMAIARGDARKMNVFDGQRWTFPRGFK